MVAEAQRPEGKVDTALVLFSREQQFAFPCVQNVPTSHSSCRVGKEKEIIILK